MCVCVFPWTKFVCGGKLIMRSGHVLDVPALRRLSWETFHNLGYILDSMYSPNFIIISVGPFTAARFWNTTTTTDPPTLHAESFYILCTLRTFPSFFFLIFISRPLLFPSTLDGSTFYFFFKQKGRGASRSVGSFLLDSSFVSLLAVYNQYFRHVWYRPPLKKIDDSLLFLLAFAGWSNWIASRSIHLPEREERARHLAILERVRMLLKYRSIPVNPFCFYLPNLYYYSMQIICI